MPPRPPPPRLTHFLCLPLVTLKSRPQLQAALNKFREDVTGDRTSEHPDSIPDKAIRPIGTLHLTIGVMSLLSQEKINDAVDFLKNLNLKDLLSDRENRDSLPLDQTNRADLKPEELKVTLRGLKSMHTSTKTSILYSPPVDDDQRLQSFCQKLKDIFVEAELLVPDKRPLLLHATIVNTIYVPGVKGRGFGRGMGKAKLTFDARDILAKYEAFEWMSDIKIERVAICQMGAKKLEDGDEEYIVDGEVGMP